MAGGKSLASEPIRHDGFPAAGMDVSAGPVAPRGALDQMHLDSGGQGEEAVGKMGAYPCLFLKAFRAR